MKFVSVALIFLAILALASARKRRKTQNGQEFILAETEIGNQNYDAAVKLIDARIPESKVLNKYERELFHKAFREAVDQRRQTIKTESMYANTQNTWGFEEWNNHKMRMETLRNEIQSLSEKAIFDIEAYLLPAAASDEERLFYTMMKADHLRYGAEFARDPMSKIDLSNKSMMAYNEAKNILMIMGLSNTSYIALILARGMAILIAEINGNSCEAVNLLDPIAMDAKSRVPSLDVVEEQNFQKAYDKLMQKYSDYSRECEFMRQSAAMPPEPYTKTYTPDPNAPYSKTCTPEFPTTMPPPVTFAEGMNMNYPAPPESSYGPDATKMPMIYDPASKTYIYPPVPEFVNATDVFGPMPSQFPMPTEYPTATQGPMPPQFPMPTEYPTATQGPMPPQYPMPNDYPMTTKEPFPNQYPMPNEYPYPTTTQGPNPTEYPMPASAIPNQYPMTTKEPIPTQYPMPVPDPITGQYPMPASGPMPNQYPMPVPDPITGQYPMPASGPMPNQYPMPVPDPITGQYPMPASGPMPNQYPMPNDYPMPVPPTATQGPFPTQYPMPVPAY